LAMLARPLVGAATVYFLLNTGLIATALALSTRPPIVSTWHNNFLRSAPSYFVGAGSAALAAAFVEHAGYWVAPLTFAPLYLTYRTYKVYMGRIEDEQRHVQQTSDLHLATIEALARAIDAKDQTTQMHIRRVQVYAAGLAKACGLSESEIQGVKTAALLHHTGTPERPYHKARAYDSAIALLKHESGRALDPKLVPLFIEMLPSLVAEFGADEREIEQEEPAPTLPGSTGAGLVPAGATNAFENI